MTQGGPWIFSWLAGTHLALTRTRISESLKPSQRAPIIRAAAVAA